MPAIAIFCHSYFSEQLIMYILFFSFSDVECVDNLDSNQQRKKDEKRRRKLLKKMHVPRLEITVKYMRKEKRKFKKILKKNKSDITGKNLFMFA